jgi:integrase
VDLRRLLCGSVEKLGLPYNLLSPGSVGADPESCEGSKETRPRRDLSATCHAAFPQVTRGGSSNRLGQRSELPDSKVDSPPDSRLLAIRNLAAIELLFATGMRVGELVSLTTTDWRADEAVFLVHGKGARQRLAVLPDDRSLGVNRDYMAQRLS